MDYDHSNNPFFFTPVGMLRIRWWPLAALLVFGISYGVWNVLTLASILAGGKGYLDTFWHAPIIWLFGS